MVFQPGTHILQDRYRIEEEIDHGSFGVVYRATYLKLNSPRAVKVLRSDMPGVDNVEIARSRERFNQEAELGDELTHANVIKVYEFGEVDDALLLVMEFATKSLKKHLGKGPLPIDEAVKIALDLCDGLTALHEQLGIVHRDLKPANILLGRDDKWKVGDLGLAQTNDSMRSRLGSNTPSHPGTPAYMSPEQKETKDYLSPASDIFSLGCVLFEAVTGKRYRDAHGSRTRDHRREIPGWLDSIIAKALQEDSGQRFHSAQDMKSSLEQRRIVSVKRPSFSAPEDVLPLALTANLTVSSPRELAEVVEQAWQTAVNYFWQGRIAKWLSDGIAKLQSIHQYPFADEWDKIARRADEIRARGMSNDPIERSAGLVEFLKGIAEYEPPKIQIAPETIEFGKASAGAGQTIDQSITLTNTGRSILEGALEPSHSALSVTPSDFKCAPDESAEAQVSFTPDESFLNTHPEISLRARTNVGQVDLPAHYVILPPEIQYKPKRLEFADIEQTEPIVVTITNKGPSLLQAKIRVAVPWLRVERAEQSLRCMPGEKLELRVFLVGNQVPQGGASESRALILETNAGEYAIAVQAPLPPTLQVKPALLDFGTLDLTTDPVVPSSVTIKITNVGTGTLRGTVQAIEPGLIVSPSDARFECGANQSHKCHVTLDANVPWSDTPKEFARAVSVFGGKDSTILRGRYSISGYPPYIFTPGKEARTLEQFVEMCLANWALAVGKFYAREFDEWLARSRKRRDLVELATMARETEKHKHAGLMAFLYELNPRAKKQVQAAAVREAYAEADQCVEENPAWANDLADWIEKQEPGFLYLGNLRARAKKASDKKKQAERIATLFNQATTLAESNPQQAHEDLIQVEIANPHYPGLPKLRTQIEQALHKLGQHERLAKWYAEAEQLLQSNNPERAFEICRQIANQDPNYPGLDPLMNRAEQIMRNTDVYPSHPSSEPPHPLPVDEVESPHKSIAWVGTFWLIFARSGRLYEYSKTTDNDLHFRRMGNTITSTLSLLLGFLFGWRTHANVVLPFGDAISGVVTLAQLILGANPYAPFQQLNITIPFWLFLCLVWLLEALLEEMFHRKWFAPSMAMSILMPIILVSHTIVVAQWWTAWPLSSTSVLGASTEALLYFICMLTAGSILASIVVYYWWQSYDMELYGFPPSGVSTVWGLPLGTLSNIVFTLTRGLGILQMVATVAICLFAAYLIAKLRDQSSIIVDTILTVLFLLSNVILIWLTITFNLSMV